MKQLTREEVKRHNIEGDLWIIIDAKVYDLSKFAAEHPGGKITLLHKDIAGQDATDAFYTFHRHNVLQPNLQIGVVEGESARMVIRNAGELSKGPHTEPSWLQDGFSSPYYKDSHRRLQKAMRKFTEEVIYPEAQEFEISGKRVSQRVLDLMAEMEIHAMRLGPGKHLLGRKLMGGIVEPEEFDYFHEMIVTHEVIRMKARGYGDGLLSGSVIGLPPVLNFGSEELKARVIPEVLSAKKFICLAVSEPGAGSDVTAMTTTAEKTEDGKFWIVNGTKKWITNGTFCDYFTVGCRTDGGYTVLLVERTEGVETKPIKTTYSASAGTAYITFTNVRVPVENTLGPEDAGLLVLLSNFNHERWVICCSSVGAQRMAVDEALKHFNQCLVLKKPFEAELPVIRQKLAQMIARVESLQSWLENVTYQMNHMSYREQSKRLVSQISLLKVQCTRYAQETAHDAVLMGGMDFMSQTGLGKNAEHYRSTVPFDALLGGAEDVLADLGVRQAMNKFPENVRL
ncbi:hypothetical protein BOTBODRAFT_27939 [Botryobasidium botryosum FD-172 SS1]|uniref:Cytochrome b5 heme-binding domain-containing protein n=1 Tax=Botryobasidium botryosum (strain FD-172 SS1) TaxID=930990 RepID=A0A067N5I0_BOTB1|nr:hypothetical protein BOTBODRAFT_27939 [Botryobasidium botryosum FD-172 SS1]